MQERGHHVSLYCVANSPLFKEASGLKLKLIAIKRNKKNFDFSAAFRLLKLLKKDQVQLVWFRDKRDLSTIGLAKSFSFGKFKILYQQAMQIGVPKTHLLHTIRFKKIDAWITPLNYLADQIKTRTKFNLKKLHVIPLAIDIDEFNSNGLDRTDARAKFGFDEDDIVVGVIGRIDPHKAQKFVKDGVVELQNKHPHLKLLIIGNKTAGEWQEYYETLRADIDLNHSNNSIQMLPFMQDVSTFYQAIDIFVMSSAKETFGMVTIEAMLSGKKIAGTGTCGTLELLNKGKFGYYFNWMNIPSLVAALDAIISNPSEAQQKAELAQAYAKENFSHQIECARIEKVIQGMFSK
jgi:glycosyltransferase involved in cell wall biosynthesis